MLHAVIVSLDFLSRLGEDGATHPYSAVKNPEAQRGRVTWAQLQD